MSADNPYRPPDEEVTFLDPLLHARMSVTFQLTEDNLRLAIGQYVKAYPWLILGGMSSFLLPCAILAYVETFYGYVPNISFWLGSGMLMAGSFSAWYLMSLPIRILTNRAVRADASLSPGVKTVTLTKDGIEVEPIGEEAGGTGVVGDAASLTEYPLQEILLRGAERGSMVLEVAKYRILIIPDHAFRSIGHRSLFTKSLKKRLRRFAVSQFFVNR